MIPHEIATLADALVESFQIDWDEAVTKAMDVHKLLKNAGIALSEIGDKS